MYALAAEAIEVNPSAAGLFPSVVIAWPAVPVDVGRLNAAKKVVKLASYA